MFSTQVRLDSEQLSLLMSRVAMGDSKAFRDLYEETSPKLFGFALRILRKPELAEDVLQESFIGIWRNARDYHSNLSAPMTWMTTIVRNKAFDALRLERVSLEICSDNFDENILNTFMDASSTPLEVLEARRNTCVLKNFIVELGSAQRQVIYLAFFHDLSHSEIAHKLGLPLGTVKTWIRRSLERIGARLYKLEVSTHGLGERPQRYAR